jgi:tRNA A-37 threonylcarbamoyl transferase component Bud32
MVTEALTPESGGWKNTLPLQESLVEDACNQIVVMIKQVKIRHNDLKLSNLIFTKGRRVHFIDFGFSVKVKIMREDELDEMVREDQETIRGLLLSSY